MVSSEGKLEQISVLNQLLSRIKEYLGTSQDKRRTKLASCDGLGLPILIWKTINEANLKNELVLSLEVDVRGKFERGLMDGYPHIISMGEIKVNSSKSGDAQKQLLLRLNCIATANDILRPEKKNPYVLKGYIFCLKKTLKNFQQIDWRMKDRSFSVIIL